MCRKGRRMAADYDQSLCLPSGAVLSLFLRNTLFRHLTQNLNLFYGIHEIQDFQFKDIFSDRLTLCIKMRYATLCRNYNWNINFWITLEKRTREDANDFNGIALQRKEKNCEYIFGIRSQMSNPWNICIDVWIAKICLKEFEKETRGRNYRPSFHENKPKTLVFSHRKRAFWACLRENWVYKFGHRCIICSAGLIHAPRIVNRLTTLRIFIFRVKSTIQEMRR